MDVSHTEHSHVIGKGGNNIKKVMEETGCHIHFPDSNRNNQAEKSNQVLCLLTVTSTGQMTESIFCVHIFLGEMRAKETACSVGRVVWPLPCKLESVLLSCGEMGRRWALISCSLSGWGRRREEVMPHKMQSLESCPSPNIHRRWDSVCGVPHGSRRLRHITCWEAFMSPVFLTLTEWCLSLVHTFVLVLVFGSRSAHLSTWKHFQYSKNQKYYLCYLEDFSLLS